MVIYKQQESGRVATADQLAETGSTTDFKKLSSALPLGNLVPLSSISGPTYVTAQLLVQQVAFKLSDKIFSFSPETFDLDIAAKDWASKEEKNIHGYPTTVYPLQTRTGAGAFALGSIFSKDFDLSKRHVPQTLLAPSLSLQNLWSSLDQLSLLYKVGSPFVAHVAAADYSAKDGLVADYGTALTLAEDLGFALISSSSAYETQHTAILATLIASVVPTLHIYDGIRMSRETLRVIDVLGEQGVREVYTGLLKEINGLNKRLDDAGKVVEIFTLLNSELGTEYKPFEYQGHRQAETVFVTFGSVEAQLARQTVSELSGNGHKVGTINVRLYRPFLEDEFLKTLPTTTQQVIVLGQVKTDSDVDDASVQSTLYTDVFAALAFSSQAASVATVVDRKYSATTTLTPTSFVKIIGKYLSTKEDETIIATTAESEQYSFWDTDSSVAVNAPAVLSKLLARDSSANVYAHETNDNLVHGGIVRTDLRSSKKSTDAPFAIESADATFVGEEKLLDKVDILNSIRTGGKLIVRLPGLKDDDIEKRLSPAVRQILAKHELQLFALDSSFSPALESDLELLVELAFLRVVRPDLNPESLRDISSPAEGTFKEVVDALQQCLRSIEVKETWSELPSDYTSPIVSPIKTHGFVGFDKTFKEPQLELSSWESAAKALAFKEAYGTQIASRPDLTVKTSAVTVKENRRLTPLTYDRNIFHIEFDLGDSGLVYNIGEALGIHADNDPEQVLAFIKDYGLNADDLVRVPAREDPNKFETRTVYQSLLQNLDILGKPPKKFYEQLAEFATDEADKNKLSSLASKEGAEDFKNRSEVDMTTYVDILDEFKSARVNFEDLVRIVAPLKRREYSIASAQAVTPNSVALMIVVVEWKDTKGRTRYGQATRFLSNLAVGTKVTVSVKPSVMKLPTNDTAPLIMAGLGTGLAPFRAFVQYRAMQKAQGKDIGAILLYMGSRHQREEYLYGEEWEAYVSAGVITLLGAAFSRDQPQKIYIQDRMRQTMKEIVDAYINNEGSFYLCGPTWPVPDVTAVLQEAIAMEAKESGRKVDASKEIERLKEESRYVLEVY